MVIFPTIQIHTIINTNSRYWPIFKLYFWIPETEICWFISIGQTIGNNSQVAHWPHRSPEEDFLHVFNIILHISCYLPLQKGVVLNLKNSEFPLYAKLVETDPFIISNWGRMWALIIKIWFPSTQGWIPSTQGCLVSSLVEIDLVVWKRGFKNI